MSVKFHLRYPYLIVDLCMYYQTVCTVLYSGWIWTGTVWHSCPPYLPPVGAVAAVQTLPQLPGCFPPPARNPWPTTAAAAAWWQTATWSVRWTLTLVKGLKVTTNVSATMSKVLSQEWSYSAVSTVQLCHCLAVVYFMIPTLSVGFASFKLVEALATACSSWTAQGLEFADVAETKLRYQIKTTIEMAFSENKLHDQVYNQQKWIPFPSINSVHSHIFVVRVYMCLYLYLDLNIVKGQGNASELPVKKLY